jgi:transcriptional regulator with XRE-family HTH domain
MNPGNHNHHYSASIALGMRLKDWRLRKEQKISAAAARLGVSTATWGHWETGEHLPSGDLLLGIEQLTEMPLRMLFCHHLDTCPQLKAGQLPVTYERCCQCGAALSVPDHPGNRST